MFLTKRAAVIVLGAMALVTLTRAAGLGPEWVRQGPYYHRTVQIPVTKYVGGNVASYQIKLEHDEVAVGEIDGNAGFSLGSTVGSLEVRKKEGKVASTKVSFGKVRYHDLNADGVLDTMGDARGVDPKVFIFLEGRLVRIANSKVAGGVERARAFDGGQRFEFVEGKWQIAP
jgi:hypothetical protein